MPKLLKGNLGSKQETFVISVVVVATVDFIIMAITLLFGSLPFK